MAFGRSSANRRQAAKKHLRETHVCPRCGLICRGNAYGSHRKVCEARFKEAREYILLFHGIDLTDAQIHHFAQKDREIWQAIQTGSFDTGEREQMVDVIVGEIMGPGEHWPLNMERGTEYSRTFPERFAAACQAHGIKGEW